MLVFSLDTYDAVIDHAKIGTPHEVCGILSGTSTEAGNAIVGTVHQTENSADHPETEYLIDPETQYALTESIENDNQEIVGFYHSHPNGPPHPSKTDTQRATWPGLSYCITILTGHHPYLGSWKWNDTTDSFEQEIVTLTHPPTGDPQQTTPPPKEE